MMNLQAYRQKRNFRKSNEPQGNSASVPSAAFVIQKHDATRLHYDFRLALDGVLKSWAVPKGPSLDPSIKRLAVEVEDHPLDYANFEGVIPDGEYGAGPVIVWDGGQWEPIGDPHDGLRRGKLHFRLTGEKLSGGWHLIRKSGGRDADQKTWFLIKDQDESAAPETGESVVDQLPLSVLSARDIATVTNEQVAQSATSRQRKRTGSKRLKTSTSAPREHGVQQVKPTTMPAKYTPQLATLSSQVPTGNDWIHERKYDGYRIGCLVSPTALRLYSRNGHDWTHRFSTLAQAMRGLPVESAWFDGEVTIDDASGNSSFASLQRALQAGDESGMYYVLFDVMYLNGMRLTNLPLEQRHTTLQSLYQMSKLSREKSPRIRLAEAIDLTGKAASSYAKKKGWEGVVSKLKSSLYTPGRSTSWRKTKWQQTDEFVIGGYTDGRGGDGIGALLLGYYNQAGQLVFAGKVGTGFSHDEARQLRDQLAPSEVNTSAFSDLKRRVGPAKSMHWIKPALVAQIRYANWTRAGQLRQASFLGLREDIEPASVTFPNQGQQTDHDVAVPKSNRKNEKGKQISARNTASKSKKEANDSPPPRSTLKTVSIPDELKSITHGERLMLADPAVTKLELANYYLQVAKWILPNLKNRLVVLVRCPDGAQKACFYQKDAPTGLLPSIQLTPVQQSKRTVNYASIKSTEELVNLIQFGTVEIHQWGSLNRDIELANQLVFDLDPGPDVLWSTTVAAAFEIRAFLEELSLRPFVKTTGGKGIHLVVPIRAKESWDVVKGFCRKVAESIATAAGDRYTSVMSNAQRHGRIFIDYLRNDRGAVSVSPYSVRNRPGANVSTPVTWDELKKLESPTIFHIGSVPNRLQTLTEDPWKDLASSSKSLSTAINKLNKILAQK